MAYATIEAKQEWRRRETTRAASRVTKRANGWITSSGWPRVKKKVCGVNGSHIRLNIC